MSDTVNPWQSPGAEVSTERGPGFSQTLSVTMVRYLKEAAPWLRFVGILSFIGCGFTVLAGIIVAISMAASAEAAEVLGASLGIAGGLVGIAMGFLYVLIGALMFFPARFIYNFGAKIRNFTLSNAEQDLEDAFKNNKSLWKFYGILSIISLALVPVGLITAIVIAATSL
ncbi:hypothetical protein AGMMS49579_01610 [Spirochaetia bacterium]|nr:hypothetical protein AGMMS49579_01610 [Spirochaetia bacterium]